MAKAGLHPFRRVANTTFEPDSFAASSLPGTGA
jgi:hypothetical protein